MLTPARPTRVPTYWEILEVGISDTMSHNVNLTDLQCRGLVCRRPNTVMTANPDAFPCQGFRA